jgi:hypothetical protein
MESMLHYGTKPQDKEYCRYPPPTLCFRSDVTPTKGVTWAPLTTKRD